MENNKLIIPASIIVAGAFIAGAIIYTPGQNVPPGSVTAQVGSAPNTGQQVAGIDVGKLKVQIDDHVLGSPTAPVVIVEYGDFECPFCGRLFEGAVKKIKDTYVKTGKVQLVYRHFPLNAIHPQAQKAAEASECAGEQGQFWPYHDILYEKKNQLSISNYKVWATELGLNANQFNNCLDSDKYAGEVSDDLEEGTILGVNGTPATFVNGRLVAGAQPFSAFEIIIEEELKK